MRKRGVRQISKYTCILWLLPNELYYHWKFYGTTTKCNGIACMSQEHERCKLKTFQYRCSAWLDWLLYYYQVFSILVFTNDVADENLHSAEYRRRSACRGEKLSPSGYGGVEGVPCPREPWQMQFEAFGCRLSHEPRKQACITVLCIQEAQ